jgi:hypothetical protein
MLNNLCFLFNFVICLLGSLAVARYLISYVYEFYHMFFCSSLRFISVIRQKPDIYSTVISYIRIYRMSTLKRLECIVFSGSKELLTNISQRTYGV